MKSNEDFYLALWTGKKMFYSVRNADCFYSTANKLTATWSEYINPYWFGHNCYNSINWLS